MTAPTNPTPTTKVPTVGELSAFCKLLAPVGPFGDVFALLADADRRQLVLVQMNVATGQVRPCPVV